ncbi:NADH dehydrogenase [ubiquinone] 1 beta subcomplex subunit 10 [Hyla sarda]|uniref:NADH dehydrogenase [ubiquinone] 1 beta subcomplex subunit 10 n=1 Tax=Hyla sarda TaxID=327740 RepID=UPI0024C30463|nr:NADH dehydrogenase [ubiquinone] 1 beta subcomplex subunit 10 [Hyla sarda]
MPDSVDKDVYPEPPSQTPAPNRQSAVPDPVPLVTGLFSFFIDSPVTAFHDWMESQRSKRRIHYYHREFRRVPYLTECMEDDILCHYEANKQFKRDHLVDQEIVRIMRERVAACRTREGESANQNCAPLLKQYAEVCKAYKNRYEDLGYYGGARNCLMKQKERMMEERKAAAQDNLE